MKKKIKLIVLIIIGILVTAWLGWLLVKDVVLGEFKIEKIAIAFFYFTAAIPLIVYWCRILSYSKHLNEIKEIMLNDVKIEKMITIGRSDYIYTDDINRKMKYYMDKRIFYKLSGKYFDLKDGLCDFEQKIDDLMDIELDKYIKENGVKQISLLITNEGFWHDNTADIKKLKEESLRYATQSMTNSQILKRVFNECEGKIKGRFFTIGIIGLICVCFKMDFYNWQIRLIACLVALVLLELPYFILVCMQYIRIRKLHSVNKRML